MDNLRALEAIAPGANPGGLVAHLIVEDELVDVSPVSLPEVAELTGRKHGDEHRRARARGVPPQAIEVRVFDGDTGELVARVSTP